MNKLGFSWPQKAAGLHKNERGNTALAVLLGFAGVILAGAIVAAIVYTSLKPHSDAAIDPKSYQAVFLTNNQAYFAHLSQLDKPYVKLTDIYYLKEQQVQPKDSAKASDQPTTSNTLVKLGGEVHGPQDVMYISRSQLSFWENLKADGQVTKAILKYKQDNKQ